MAEVVEASTTQFVAQCYHLHQAPPLGALVRAGTSPSVYGVVGHIATAGIDPGRRAVPLGADAASEEEVYAEHPQLGRLLRTQFQCQTVGYLEGQQLRHRLPPLPPRLHSFVFVCRAEEVRAFTARLDFLPLLLRATLAAGDEVVAACLRGAAMAYPDPGAFLLRASREVAALLAGDLPRLNLVLRALA